MTQADESLESEEPQEEPEENVEESAEIVDDGGKFFKPKKPIMGGLMKQPDSSWIAWTGGAPVPHWTGLLVPKPTRVLPTQFKPLSVGSSIKNQCHSTLGITPEFSRKSDVLIFQREVKEHLEMCGVDSISHPPDPHNSTEMISILINHSRCTASEAKDMEETQFKLCDECDHTNIHCAKEHLRNSVDKDLKKQLCENCPQNTTFIVTWMHLMEIIRTVSIDRFEEIKNRIKRRSLKDCAGQNVESLCSDHLNDCLELEGAESCDNALTMKMLKTIMMGGNEDFRFNLRSVKKDLDGKLLAVRHCSCEEASKGLAAHKLDVRSILTTAKTEHRKLFDHGEWPAAQHVRDDRALAKSCGNAMVAIGEKSAKLIANAPQRSNMTGRDKSNDTCNNCGEKGHWASDCPKSKFNNGSGKTRFNNDNGNNKRGTNRNRQLQNKFPPPKDGESEIKIDTDGKKCHWCSKCRRWTISHGADTHKSNEELKANRRQANVGLTRVNFDVSPAACAVSFRMSPELKKHFDECITDQHFCKPDAIQLNWLWLVIVETMAAAVALFAMTGHNPMGLALGGLALVVAWLCIDPRRACDAVTERVKDCVLQEQRCTNHCLTERLRSVEGQVNGLSFGRIKTLEDRLNHLEQAIRDTSEIEPCRRQLCRNEPVRPTKPRRQQCRPAACVADWNCAHASRSDESRADDPAHARDHAVLFDSGANCCVTNKKCDFVGRHHELNDNSVVSGLGEALKVKGIGHVAWTFLADDDTHRTLKLPAICVPGCNLCVASTSVVLQRCELEHFTLTSAHLKLSGSNDCPSLSVPLCKDTNSPVAHVVRDWDSSANYFSPKRDFDDPSVFAAFARGLTTSDPFLEQCLAKSAVCLSEARQDEALRVAAAADDTTRNPFAEHKPTPSALEGANFNLTEPEKELLRWHHKLGHLSFRRVLWLFRQGVLAVTERAKRLQAAALKLTKVPLCTACQCAKQRRKATPGTVNKVVPEQVDALKVDRLFPGQQVSVDHFCANPKGRLVATFGKEPEKNKCVGGAIFVDHASGCVCVELQASMSSHDTLEAVKAFEKAMMSHGVVIQSHLTDDGSVFTNKDFVKHLEVFKQDSRLAGVGAHHSNGMAERSIGTVTSIARAMLHHAAIHWSDAADVALWPLAVIHAVHILDRVPREDSGQSPHEMLTRTVWPRSKFHDLHVWGCPCHVLDNSLADAKKIPRWKARSERCACVGVSPKHGHQVPHVLSLDTGWISPQCHVVCDDWFQTVSATDHALPNFDDDEWHKTFGLAPLQHIKDDVDNEESPVMSSTEPGLLEQQQIRAIAQEEALPPVPLQPDPGHHKPPVPFDEPIVPLVVTPPSHPPQIQTEPIQREATPPPVAPPQREKDPVSIDSDQSQPDPADADRSEVVPPAPEQLTAPTDDTTPAAPAPPIETEPAPPPAERPSGVPPPRVPRSRVPANFQPIIRARSQVAPRRSQRLRVDHSQAEVGQVDPESLDTLHDLHCNPALADPLTAFWTRVFESDPLAATMHSTVPFAMLAHAASETKSDPDTLTWEQAMARADAEEFREAADLELRQLEEQGTWIEVPKSSATTKIIPSTWVFRIKRSPDGKEKRKKGRPVLRGDLQDCQGETTFSPVAAWSTVRTLMVLSAVKSRVTCTIDFSNAFVQSPLPPDEPVCMHVPRGHKSEKGPDHCLKLLKSLHGHCAAPLLWCNHITSHFTKLGLEKSQFDPCLWCGRGLVLVPCVDDVCLGAASMDDIDAFIKDLRDEGLTLTKDETLSEFLGVKFEQTPDGSVNMTQTGLINKILQAAKMEDSNPNALPAEQKALASDEDGEPHQEAWNCRAIVGVILCLSTNTRPDLCFSVSQVAKFSNNPTKPHATAIERILRCLKATQDKGTLVKPTTDLHLDVWVDADFAGLFGSEDPTLPDSARSRTGHVISLSDWPILWKSQLQTHTSLSALEAECSALSHALKTHLPLKWLIDEMINMIDKKPLKAISIHATVFEDNVGAFHLATNHRQSHRTKHFSVKFHWFWEHAREFKLVKCDTKVMRADFCTKMLPREAFERNRKLVIGWWPIT